MHPQSEAAEACLLPGLAGRERGLEGILCLMQYKLGPWAPNEREPDGPRRAPTGRQSPQGCANAPRQDERT